MASLDDKSKRNLQNLARKYDANLQLCHRLDKNTSGILLMAKNPESYRHIAMQFQKRKVRKQYLTLIAGIHQFEDYRIELPLLVSTNKKVSINKNEGKKAITIINTEQTFRNYTLLNCEPITGRMHQIRAHLAAVKCPIIGDQLYGGEDIYLSRLKRNYHHSSRKEEQAVNRGYLLHAKSLSFSHPRSEQGITIEAPLPKAFAVTLKVLSKYNQAH